jgi:pimeloyl-ACP methyl ester carboxylesterase
MRDQARLLADHTPGARLAILPSTAHAPSIERPEAFDDVVIPWLAGTEAPGTASRR